MNAFQGLHYEYVEREHSAEEWLEAFSKFKPYWLEITGGEPTQYKDLAKILKNLPEDCIWSITTNASNIKPFLEAGPEKCVSLTASFHPYAKKPYSDPSWFRDQLSILKNNGFPIQVTIVGYPYNIDKLEGWVRFFEQEFFVNVMPFLNRQWDWNKHPELKEKIIKFKNYWFGNQKLSWKPSIFEKCRAGVKYCLVNPNGRVYRCYSAFIQGKYYIGNIFDKEFSLYKEARKCSIGCYFPCDLEVAK